MNHVIYVKKVSASKIRNPMGMLQYKAAPETWSRTEISRNRFSHTHTASLSVMISFPNVAHSTAMIPPCSVQNLIIIKELWWKWWKWFHGMWGWNEVWINIPNSPQHTRWDMLHQNATTLRTRKAVVVNGAYNVWFPAEEHMLYGRYWSYT